MSCFPDASFLCALYRAQINSQSADQFVVGLSGALGHRACCRWSSGSPSAGRFGCISMTPEKASLNRKASKCSMTFGLISTQACCRRFRWIGPLCISVRKR